MGLQRRATVLGAGIQGVCTALALAQGGWTVSLIDRAATPMQGASARGEGKLHLGYVYANDRSRATAALMLEGALSFADLIDRWLPRPVPWDEVRSEPFLYGVLPTSMVGVEALVEHYAWVDARVAERCAGGGSYAGTPGPAPVRRLASPTEAGLSDEVTAAFATGEVAVEPTRLRAPLVAGLHAAEVVVHGESTVQEVARTPSGFVVTTAAADGRATTHAADVVVNCLWDGRLAVDATLGIEAPRPWLYRLKHAVHGTVPDSSTPPPSVTLVLGPYGDVVRHASGRVYASWYPVCMTDTSSALTPPPAWLPAMAGSGPQPERDQIARSTVHELAAHVPDLAGMRVDLAAAGVIVAWGETDIDEVDSELHRRHQIGVHDHDGYVSVDTGKLTTAPLFAQQAADLLDR